MTDQSAPSDYSGNQQLAASALAARQRAYAPYSKFLVGAALLTDDGEVFSGCNVENASFGLTICAERVAATNAIANGYRRFKKIAVASQGAVTPCGACRQFLIEFGPQLEVLLVDAETGQISRQFVLGDLLPETFELRE